MWDTCKSGEKRDGVVRKSRSGQRKWEKEMEGECVEKRDGRREDLIKDRREGDDRIDREKDVYKEKQEEGRTREV